MRWENLSKLIGICEKELETYGYFMVNMKKSGFNQVITAKDLKNFS